MQKAKGLIFDLDGVIVDTARHHFLAWKRLADQLGIPFTPEDNEQLKGVSRARSLEILLNLGGLVVDDVQRQELAARKNAWYVESIKHLDASEILPGVREYLLQQRRQGKRVALGSASKNAALILERLQIAALFDAMIDGNKVSRAKPDPEVFLRGASELGLSAVECVVFEDAAAGVEAARRAGMRVVGIGDPAILRGADHMIAGLHELMANMVTK